MPEATSREHPAASTWAPARIRVRTPRLELRVPTDDELAQLAHAALQGVHEPDVMPFAAAWTEEDPAEIPGSMYRWHMTCRGNWSPDSWTLLLVAFVDGKPVGAQDVMAAKFAVRREIGTASWLAKAHQGQGLGTEMREAALHLAFEGLGALGCGSGAYDDNIASNRVSEKAGYERNGVRVVTCPRGPRAPGGVRVERAIEVLYRITREAWQERRRDDIELLGIDDDVLAATGAT